MQEVCGSAFVTGSEDLLCLLRDVNNLGTSDDELSEL